MIAPQLLTGQLNQTHEGARVKGYQQGINHQWIADPQPYYTPNNDIAIAHPTAARGEGQQSKEADSNQSAPERLFDFNHPGHGAIEQLRRFKPDPKRH